MLTQETDEAAASGWYHRKIIMRAGLLRESVLHRYAQYCNVVRRRLLIGQLKQSVNIRDLDSGGRGRKFESSHPDQYFHVVTAQHSGSQLSASPRKSTVSPNDNVDLSPPRLRPEICRVAPKCAGFCLRLHPTNHAKDTQLFAESLATHARTI